MVSPALLLPILTSLMSGSGQNKYPNFKAYSSPIGPLPQGAAPRSASDARAARSFHEVARMKHDREAMTAFIGKAKLAAGGLAAVGGAITASKLPKLITNWGESLLKSQEHLGRYSGLIARSAGRFEARNILRDIRTASQTSRSTAFLSRSISDLKDAMNPAVIALGNLTRNALAYSAKAIEVPFELYGDYLKWLKKMFDIDEWPEDNPHPFKDFINDAKEGRLESIVPMPRN